MKKPIICSVVASTVVFSILISGCFGGGSSSSIGTVPGSDTVDNSNPKQDTAMIQINIGDGTRKSVNPISGGTVVITRNDDGTQNVATVVHGELNECAKVTSDDNGDGVICGPKKGVTYAFQSNFGALGPVDDNASTFDGGLLLFDALTYYNGVQYDTPVEGNVSENRIQEVYIPSNYIKLTDELKNNGSVNEQYDIMKDYLANAYNMQFLFEEDSHNPYFKDGKTEGTFVATYVMWFTRGKGEVELKEEFESGNIENLEYLAVEFLLKVEQTDNNSSKLKFTVPEDSKIVFGGKRHGEGGILVSTANHIINSVDYESQNYVDSKFTINIMEYFNKIIDRSQDDFGLSDYFKGIIVENAQNPWPVKIYGTLHEKKDDGTYDRSFIRNPGTMDAELFVLTHSSAPFSKAYDKDPKNTVKAIKFNIVYPGGEYNQLED